MKKKIWTLLLAICVAFVLFWAISIVKCEIQTHKYGAQFAGKEQLYTMLRPSEQCKVLQYTQTNAKVYYRTPGSGGDVLYFERDDQSGEWHFVRWETIWSATGSADGFVWPYIR